MFSKKITKLITVIVIFFSISSTTFAGYDYIKTNQLINESVRLAEEEKYDISLSLLESAENRFLTKKFNIPQISPLPGIRLRGSCFIVFKLQQYSGKLSIYCWMYSCYYLNSVYSISADENVAAHPYAHDKRWFCLFSWFYDYLLNRTLCTS